MAPLRILLVLMLCGTAFAQNIITTYAGNDWQFPGDGKRALDAPLGGALGLTVAADAQGNYYIADSDNRMIFKVGADGILHVVAGNGILALSGDGGPATAAAIGSPLDITVDSKGNIYYTEVSRVRKIDTNGIITTVAGSDTEGFSGDGGPATSATFNYLWAIACDSADNLYVADQANHRIRKIVPGGIVTTIAGNGKTDFPQDGPALDSSLNRPAGLAVDAAGNVYFSDTTAATASFPYTLGIVRKINPAGVLSTVIAPLDASGNILYFYPSRMTVDAAGNVYFIELLSYSIYALLPNGSVQLVAGLGLGAGTSGYGGDGGPATKARFNIFSGGLAVDNKGVNLYIGDNNNLRVRRIDSTGRVDTVAGNGKFRATESLPAASTPLYKPVSVRFDPAGNLYIAEPLVNRIRKVATNGATSIFAGTGEPSFSGDQGPAAQAGLSWPYAVATDTKGNVFIGDALNNRVRRVGPDGIITTVAGGGATLATGDGGPATNAHLSLVEGVVVDSTGVIYIADGYDHRIRKVAADGTITTIAGTGQAGYSGDGGPAAQAQVNEPTGITIGPDGNLYFCDSRNNRIRKIVLANGTISTAAGTGDKKFAGDGGPPLQASFNYPRGLTFDRSGNLYIADASNYVIRRIDTYNVVQTVAGTPGFSGIEGDNTGGDGHPATQAFLAAPYDVAVDAAGNLFIAEFGNDRVRVVLVTPPQFQVFPTALGYTAVRGDEVTPAKNLYISGSIPGLPFTLTGNKKWLQLNTVAGVTPATIQVAVDPAQIGEDTSPGAITISIPATSTGTRATTVELTLGVALPGGIHIQSDVLSFAQFQGTPAPARSVTIVNDSSSDAPISASADSASPWLRVTPASVTVPSRSQVTLQVSIDPALQTGTYSGSLVVTDQRDGDSDSLGVNVTVSAVPQSIFLTQSGLTFTAVVGGGVTPPQSVGVLNLGRGLMNWTLSATDLTGTKVDWLSVTPDGGGSDAASSAVPQFTVTANAANLVAGSYYGQVRVAAPGADNSPQFVLVVLTVLPAGTDPGPIVQPTSLVFNASLGSTSPGSQTVTVTNLFTQPVNFTSGRSTEDGKPWFTHIPGAGVIAPGQFTRFIVQPLTTALGPGVYRGSLTLLFDGGVARTLGVVVIVAGNTSSTSQKPGDRSAGTCGPTKLVPVFTSIGAEAAVPAGWPQRLLVRVLDDCGTPMTSGGVGAQFSANILPINLTSLKDGTWAGTWQSRSDTSTSVTIKVKAEIPDQKLTGTAEVTSSITPNTDPPVLQNDAIVSAASLLAQKPLAPGSLISIRGARLARAATSAGSYPLPTQLAGTLVAMGGKALPLVDVADDHITAVLPYEIPVNTRLQLIVQRGSTAAVPENVTLAVVQPAIFTQDQSGTGQGVISKSNADGSSTLAAPGNPVTAGDTIVISCTGLGPVDPAVPAGNAAPDTPLAKVTAPVTLTIGGVHADVQVAALQPGLTGIYQVVATVPSGVSGGDAVAVVITAGNQSSPPVTIAVQ